MLAREKVHFLLWKYISRSWHKYFSDIYTNTAVIFAQIQLGMRGADERVFSRFHQRPVLCSSFSPRAPASAPLL